MKRLFKAAALAAAICSTPAFAAKWHMPTPYADSNLCTQIVHEFADEVRDLTDGELDIQVHSGSSLMKHPEIPRAVKTGQVQLGEVFIAVMGNDSPVFKHDNIPFLATTYDDAEKLWAAARPELEKELDKQGMKLMYAMPWPAQGIYTKKAINDVADLDGLKMRVNSPSTSRLSDLLGTVPVTIQTPELPQAFSTGLVDAMLTSPSTGVDSQSWDYLSHFNDAQAWIPKNMVVVNKRAFQRLDEAQQNALLKAAADAETHGWQRVRELAKEDTQTLRDHGIVVSEPSDALKAELQKVGETMAEEWKQEAPEQVERILSAYNAAK